MKAPFIRSAYNYDTVQASDDSACDTKGDSLTVQSQAEDADINNLMRRYGITGAFPENPRVPQYGDFTHITDFRSALEAVRSAEESFMAFPAEVRSRFDNDPQKMLVYMENGGSPEALKELFEKRAVAVPPVAATGAVSAPAVPVQAGGSGPASTGGTGA